MKKARFKGEGDTAPISERNKNANKVGNGRCILLRHRLSCIAAITMLAFTCWSVQGQAATIAAGGEHSLGIKRNGTVAAWGYNAYGQCDVPAGLKQVVAVAAGYLHSLALKSDGSVVAWGLNAYGQCDVPADLGQVVAVAAGGLHSLALKLGGTVAAWGRNNYGQCGVPAGLNLKVIFKTPSKPISPKPISPSVYLLLLLE